MTTLIFFLTAIYIIVLMVMLIAKLFSRRPSMRTLKLLIIVLSIYGSLWLFFFFNKDYHTVPLGTDICFDDWCATIVKIDQKPAPDSLSIVLQVVMSNHARGIAQKPSEPRIHIIDRQNHSWPALQAGWVPIDSRLNLGESKMATLKCKIPNSNKMLFVLIEEGPWITNLLLPQDQDIFVITR